MNNIQIALLAIIHILICLLFFGINIRFKGFQDSFYKFCILFFLPAAGLLYFLITFILSRISNKSDSMAESYLKYIREQKHIYYEEAVDFEREMNIIPMEDSLNFSSDKIRRAYLIYILKKDFSSHIKGLKKAIKSNDTETSHYAAAALMEIKKQYEILLSNANDEYIRDKDSLSVLENYASLLKKYLKSGLSDKIDHANYLEKYSDILTSILEQHDTTEVYFIDKINTSIELMDSLNAQKYCDLLFKKFPKSENPYILLLKLYYRANESELFKEVLDDFKKKKTSLSEYGESVLKFWEETS